MSWGESQEFGESQSLQFDESLFEESQSQEFEFVSQPQEFGESQSQEFDESQFQPTQEFGESQFQPMQEFDVSQFQPTQEFAESQFQPTQGHGQQIRKKHALGEIAGMTTICTTWAHTIHECPFTRSFHDRAEELIIDLTRVKSGIEHGPDTLTPDLVAGYSSVSQRFGETNKIANRLQFEPMPKRLKRNNTEEDADDDDNDKKNNDVAELDDTQEMDDTQHAQRTEVLLDLLDL